MQFRCNDGECVLQSTVCDDRKDCTDGSDELGCGEQFICHFHLLLCNTLSRATASIQNVNSTKVYGLYCKSLICTFKIGNVQ